MTESPASPPAGRIQSIDALRGFDMFWITGGRELIAGAVGVLCGGVPGWLAFHTSHVEWEGFAGWDLIMPLFLFIVGAAMPFAFAQRLGETRALGPVYRKIARRVALLWVLGMIAQGHLMEGIFTLDPWKIHFYSNTLQAIASGYLIAAVALLHLPRWGQGVLCAALLLGYWALMALVPVPGHGAGALTPDGNLAMYIDETLLGPFRDGTTYTWILSSLTFAGSVLLGVFGGHLLRSGRPRLFTLGVLVAAGVACLGGGWLWGQAFTIIKHIWTSSMVLWAAGWSYLLLALFYWLIDIRGWRRWAFPFTPLGANAIVAYMLGEFLMLGVVEGVFEWLGAPRAPATELGVGLVTFGALWTGLYVLYRKRIFIKV